MSLATITVVQAPPSDPAAHMRRTVWVWQCRFDAHVISCDCFQAAAVGSERGVPGLLAAHVFFAS